MWKNPPNIEHSWYFFFVFTRHKGKKPVSLYFSLMSINGILKGENDESKAEHTENRNTSPRERKLGKGERRSGTKIFRQTHLFGSWLLYASRNSLPLCVLLYDILLWIFYSSSSWTTYRFYLYLSLYITQFARHHRQSLSLISHSSSLKIQDFDLSLSLDFTPISLLYTYSVHKTSRAIIMPLLPTVLINDPPPWPLPEPWLMRVMSRCRPSCFLCALHVICEVT